MTFHNMQEENEIIIEKDLDFPEEEEGESVYPDDLRNFDLGIRQDKLTVYEILRRYEEGRIILDANFQRNIVWDKKKMSRFIETLLIGLPVPAMYFNQTIEGKLIVIDGRQRISTLICFLGKMKKDDVFPFPNFKLEGLKSLSELNGLTYADLGKKVGYQVRITDESFFVYVIKPSAQMPIIYDIFDRINTGGTILNRQEVRNALRVGKSTILLKKLANQPYFNDAIGGGISDKRMKAQESVLRVLCFMIFDYELDYKGNLGSFLERGMTEINQMTDEQITQLEAKFERVMTKSYWLFGKANFRFEISSSKRSAINLAIMDSVCNFIHHCDDNFLQQNEAKIRLNYSKLINNSEYKAVSGQGTGSKAKLKKRFELAKQFLSDIH